MRRGLLLIVALLCLLPAQNAEAAFKFGADETIHFLQDVSLKGAKEEALYLGYRTKIQFFVAGLYVTDEGYVLGVKGVWVRSRDELLANWRRLHAGGFGLMAQEYVPGTAADHYFVDGFRDAHGRIAGLCARILSQYPKMTVFQVKGALYLAAANVHVDHVRGTHVVETGGAPS